MARKLNLSISNIAERRQQMRAKNIIDFFHRQDEIL